VPGVTQISVAICTHNPVAATLARCLKALRAQTDIPSGTELLVVDNASQPPITLPPEFTSIPGIASVRLVREEQLGLTYARQRALQEAQGEVVVFVDDDNFLRPDYLVVTVQFFSEHPQAGAAGGRSHGLYETPPPVWLETAADYLAISDHGDQPFKLSEPGWWAPAGAGMAVRRDLALQAFAQPMLLSDRRGKALSSGGDTEICYRICRQGYELWYVPELVLEHFMPAARLEPAYLLKLARGIGQSQAILELYRMPEDRRGSLLALRRAIYFGRLGVAQKRRASKATDEAARIGAQMRSNHLLAQSAALFGLCFNLPRL